MKSKITMLRTPVKQIIPGLSSVILVRLQAQFPSELPHTAHCGAQLGALINLIKFAGKFTPRMKFRIIGAQWVPTQAAGQGPIWEAPG